MAKEIKFKKFTNIRELEEGQTLRNTGSGEVYTIIFTDGYTVVATRSLTVTNPFEWEIVKK